KFHARQPETHPGTHGLPHFRCLAATPAVLAPVRVVRGAAVVARKDELGDLVEQQDRSGGADDRRAWCDDRRFDPSCTSLPAAYFGRSRTERRRTGLGPDVVFWRCPFGRHARGAVP